MPPQLALILCTIFVLFLLRLERKQAHNVSHALWIPTIWMLSIASRSLGAWFGNEGVTVESGSQLDQYFLSALLCIGLVILFLRRFSWSRTIKENPWLMLLIGYMFISILWSDIPFVSFKRWIRELLAVTMACVVLSEWNPRQAMQSLFRRTAYILIPFSLLLIKYFGAIGVKWNHWSGEASWIGVTPQKNGLGQLCFISAFFFIWELIRRWKGSNSLVSKYQTYADVFVLIITLWLLKGPPNSFSATSIVALAMGLTTLVGLLWMKRHQVKLGKNVFTMIIALAIVYGILVPMMGGLSVGVVTSSLGRDETLTGRTDFWARLVPTAMQKPILGHGFGGFWTSRAHEVYDISGPHNGYLGLLLELGFVGIFLVSMYLLSYGSKARRALYYDYDWGSLSICYLIMALLQNITEASFHTLTNHMTAVLLFLALSLTSATLYTSEVHEKDISQLGML